MNRDGTVDRLLKRNLPRMDTQAAGTCLDAETMAAWVEGGLPEPMRAVAEAHVADCARCLGLLATLANTEPVVIEQSWWTRLLRLRWLVPATAAAAAVLLWVLVERPPAPVMVQPTADDRAAKTYTDAHPPSELQSSAETPAGPGRESPDSMQQPAEARLRPGASRGQAELGQSAADAPSAGTPAAPPSVPAGDPATMTLERRGLAESVPDQSAPSPSELAEIERQYDRALFRDAAGGTAEIVSPDPAVRWRLVGSTIERSADGGVTWDRQPAGVSTLLLAGSAPAPTVCWVVGRGGVVLRSIDGATWTQLASPERADLVAVAATSASAATVTTAGGLAYHTADGGRTWALQEKSEAPF